MPCFRPCSTHVFACIASLAELGIVKPDELISAYELLACNSTLRLGQKARGRGLGIPIISSALALMNEMAGFADAGVSGKIGGRVNLLRGITGHNTRAG